MKLGLGTGSTAKWFVDLLAAAEAAPRGCRITGVPTSSRTKAQAEALGIPLATLDQAGWLDLTIDGADEFDADLNLIKGGGGALLQEKIVASASTRMVVITDPSKEVAILGAFPLPVELVRFGASTTMRLISDLLERHDVGGRDLTTRQGAGGPYITDEGHYIVDLALGPHRRPGPPEHRAEHHSRRGRDRSVRRHRLGDCGGRAGWHRAGYRPQAMLSVAWAGISRPQAAPSESLMDPSQAQIRSDHFNPTTPRR